MEAELTDGQKVQIERMNGKAGDLQEGCAGHPDWRNYSTSTQQISDGLKLPSLQSKQNHVCSSLAANLTRSCVNTASMAQSLS